MWLLAIVDARTSLSQAVETAEGSSVFEKNGRSEGRRLWSKGGGNVECGTAEAREKGAKVERGCREVEGPATAAAVVGGADDPTRGDGS